MNSPAAVPTRPTHPGPPLVFPAIACALLFIAPGLLGGVLGADGAIPSPFTTTNTVVTYFATNHAMTQLTGFLLLLSALFLGLFTAVAASRIKYLAPTAPGPTIVLAGGVIAATLLATSAVVQWSLSFTAVTDLPALTHALHYVSFALGGAGHVGALGVLILGLAVTSWYVGRVPHWLCAVGFVIAIAALGSTVSLAVTPLSVLIPLGRFAGLLWLIVVSAVIPRVRAARR
ncbi:hypothetical protein [Sciscionella marina]|uniref:hypothetical protein n=1 Tax=Sciscionella marina TaxID=508770 RepID=UPI0003804107|nr:hypothetical protein [Sciscionella marina]